MGDESCWHLAKFYMLIQILALNVLYKFEVIVTVINQWSLKFKLLGKDHINDFILFSNNYDPPPINHKGQVIGRRLGTMQIYAYIFYRASSMAESNQKRVNRKTKA